MVRCVQCPAQAEDTFVIAANDALHFFALIVICSDSWSLLHFILFHLLYNFMILLILFLVCDCSHGPVLLRAGAGRPCDAAQQGSSRNDQTSLHDLNCLKMKKIEKFFGLCLYFWRVPCPAWGWAARCRATWRTGWGWRPGRWRSGGRRPGWSRSPPPATMVPAPCPHAEPAQLFAWFLLVWKSGWMPKYKNICIH